MNCFLRGRRAKYKAHTDDSGHIYVGNRLTEFRKMLGLSQEEMAADMGVDQTKVSRWETNKEPMEPYHIKLLRDTYKHSRIDLYTRCRMLEEEYYREPVAL